MRAINDTEIMGGTGFGRDEFPSSFTHHTEFGIFAGLSRENKFDPYLPIKNEPMGHDYSKNNFGSSEKVERRYKYRPLYDMEQYPYDEEKYSEANRRIIQKVLGDSSTALQSPIELFHGGNLDMQGSDTMVLFVIFVFVILLLCAMMHRSYMKHSKELSNLVQLLIAKRT